MTAIALAGRRIDEIGSDQVIFPLPAIGHVDRALRTTFSNNNGTDLVSSAACGADLIGLRCAMDMNIRTHVILPFSKQRFRRTSVVDRPGNWGDLFDAALEYAEARGSVITVSRAADDAASYRSVTRTIIEFVYTLSPAPIAVAVWDGPRMTAGADETAHFVQLAAARSMPLVEVAVVGK